MKLLCARAVRSTLALRPISASICSLTVVLRFEDMPAHRSDAASAARRLIRLSALGTCCPLPWPSLRLTTRTTAAKRDDDTPDSHRGRCDPDLWNTQTALVEQLLAFLTTDVWQVEFVGGGYAPAINTPVQPSSEDCVVLLSGGLDSLIAAPSTLRWLGGARARGSVMLATGR